MNEKTTFHFKAATGSGAVIDGSVASSNEAQVKTDLMRQGLIPVRIWTNDPKRKASLVDVIRRVARSFVTSSQIPV